MDSDQTLKILKMVQEGFLTPEQGQRLINELFAGSQTQNSQSQSQDKKDHQGCPHGGPEIDLFSFLGEAGKNLTQGVEKLFSFAGQTVREGMGLAPQNVVLKILDLEGTAERYQVTIPMKIFTALKPLLVATPPLIVHPLQKIDYSAIYQALESGTTGKVFEYLDHERGDRLEVWVV